MFDSFIDWARLAVIVVLIVAMLGPRKATLLALCIPLFMVWSIPVHWMLSDVWSQLNADPETPESVKRLALVVTNLLAVFWAFFSAALFTIPKWSPWYRSGFFTRYLSLSRSPEERV